MQVEIIDLAYDIDCPGAYENIQALVPLKNGKIDYEHPLIKWVFVEDDVDLWKSEVPILSIDVIITCESIQVSEDRLEIEFPDGTIAAFEIDSDEWARIKII